jgi:hypothetical protein
MNVSVKTKGTCLRTVRLQAVYVMLLAVGGVGTLLLSSCARNPTSGFRFAVLGDSRGSEKVFPAIVDSLNRIHPAFAVHLGDLIHGYTDDLSIVKKQWHVVDRQLSDLRIPLFVAPGNHDTYTGKATADPRLVEFLRQRFGDWPRSIERSGALFLFLDSSRPGEEQMIGPSQLAWLHRELERWGSSKGPAFLFVHHPLVSPMGRSIKNADEVLALLKGSSARIVFCSHDHMYHKSILPSGIQQYITGGAGASLRGLPAERGGFFHFLVATLDNRGKPAVAVHRLEAVSESMQPWPPRDYGH